jgi:hypothetical protein
VQIIGRRLKDEVLLQHAKVIEKILLGRIKVAPASITLADENATVLATCRFNNGVCSVTERSARAGPSKEIRGRSGS